MPVIDGPRPRGGPRREALWLSRRARLGTGPRDPWLSNSMWLSRNAAARMQSMAVQVRGYKSGSGAEPMGVQDWLGHGCPRPMAVAVQDRWLEPWVSRDWTPGIWFGRRTRWVSRIGSPASPVAETGGCPGTWAEPGGGVGLHGARWVSRSGTEPDGCPGFGVRWVSRSGVRAELMGVQEWGSGFGLAVGGWVEV